jgi:hypothetical protein
MTVCLLSSIKTSALPASNAHASGDAQILWDSGDAQILWDIGHFSHSFCEHRS